MFENWSKRLARIAHQALFVLYLHLTILEWWRGTRTKETLATTWACEKFASYVLGKKFTIETDHKPLVPLLGNKRLHSLPPRIYVFDWDWHTLSMKSFMFLEDPWLWLILSPVPQFSPQIMMYTACKRELNILWKHVSITYLLAASVWQNFMDLRLPTLSA